MIRPLVVLEGAGRAATSAAPAGGGVRRIKAVVTIEGLDRPTETITVRGSAGRYYMAHVADPEDLTKMHVGDTIGLSRSLKRRSYRWKELPIS